jgi:hypothetical protein
VLIIVDLLKKNTMKINLLLAIAIAFFTSNSNAQSIAHKDSINTIIKMYYDLNVKVSQADSSPTDVENIFKIFTDDFNYVHPKYGGVYTREDLHKGYLRNQKAGRYNGNVTDIKIINKIVGLDSAVVEKRFITKDEGEGESQMTLFEFKKGKISKIFEYW